MSLYTVKGETLTAIAAENDAGRKLKYFVRGDMGVSYGQFSSLKQQNGLLVNGVPVHATHLLRPGDAVTVVLADIPSEKAVTPEEGSVSVVYGDEDLIILDKPAPLACQCSPKQPEGTLENRLAFLYRDRPGFVFRPLNRLDKGTSGLLAAAKHAHATQLLQKQLHTDSFVREYLAVTEGHFEGSGIISLPISQANDATIRRVIDHENGKEAVTDYRVVAHGTGRTLVRLRLETVRTHQIRLHLASIGHPICGDFLYGTELDELPGRFALHSAYLALNHPITGQRIERESPLPYELQQLLQKSNT
jgi:23S rRNA pseudouridine1911/1915/1917 synthase